MNLSLSRLVIGLVALLGVAGCSLPGQPKQSVTYFILSDSAPIAPAGATKLATLLLRDMEAALFYQDTRLIHSRAPGTRAHYQYAAWSEPPPRRLTWLLRQRLEAAGVFSTVAPLGAGVVGDYQLNTRLVDFYHDAATPPGQALFLLEAELIKRAPARLVARRIFVAQAPLAGYDAEAAADALGRAADEVLDAVIAWLAAPAPQ